MGLSGCPFVCLSVCLSVLFLSMFSACLCLAVSLSLFLFLCMCLSVCLSVPLRLPPRTFSCSLPSLTAFLIRSGPPAELVSVGRSSRNEGLLAQRDRETHRHTRRSIEKKKRGYSHRETDRQTDRHTHRDTQRHTQALTHKQTHSVPRSEMKFGVPIQIRYNWPQRSPTSSSFSRIVSFFFCRASSIAFQIDPSSSSS